MPVAPRIRSTGEVLQIADQRDDAMPAVFECHQCFGVPKRAGGVQASQAREETVTRMHQDIGPQAGCFELQRGLAEKALVSVVDVSDRAVGVAVMGGQGVGSRFDPPTAISCGVVTRSARLRGRPGQLRDRDAVAISLIPTDGAGLVVPLLLALSDDVQFPTLACYRHIAVSLDPFRSYLPCGRRDGKLCGMRSVFWTLLLFGILTSGRFADARVGVTVVERCRMPAGWSEVARTHPRYVVFGEIHGTREAPAFVGDVACSLAQRGEHVLVAVEHGVVNDAAFQAAWLLPRREFEKAIVKVGWAGRQDGVASSAMLAMLQRLYQLKEAGSSISITAFNGTRDDDQRSRFAGLPGQGPHEAAQAENIRKAADAGHFDRVLVLVGNLHARKEPVGDGTDAFRPMAMQLATPKQIVSLNMVTAGGTMWNCVVRPDLQLDESKPIPEDAIECGDHPTTARLSRRAMPFMALGRPLGFDENDGYDGVFWLGRVHGSKPAVGRS